MGNESRKKDSILSSWGNQITTWVSLWLLYEEPRTTPPLQDFDAMCRDLLPADVLLFKGRSRVSRVISVVSQSQWTHAALYIGRLSDYPKDSKITGLIQKNFDGDANEQLVVESLLHRGLVITPLSNYAHDGIRLCRPRGILEEDTKLIVQNVLAQTGREYDIRQLIDLGRFIFPYTILPRRWLSSLFNYKPGGATRTVCSTVLAEAFMVVKFPVIPVIHGNEGNVSVTRRNPKLFTPRDFDYSPYFDIIKFPYMNYDQSFLGVRTKGGYRELPWSENENLYCNSENECFVSEQDGEDLKKDEVKES